MQESKTGKGARGLVNVSVCLLTLHPIPNVILTFAPLGVILKMYEDTKSHNIISNLKHFSVDIPFIYFDILVDSTVETKRLNNKVYHKNVIECILCKLVRPSPHELVPNISQYTFNNI